MTIACNCPRCQAYHMLVVKGKQGLWQNGDVTNQIQGGGNETN
jgi:hypothetical protein